MAPTAWPAGKSARRSTECLCGGGQAALGLGSVLTFEEGREGAWNRGSPPRARLLLRARVAAATRRRRTRARGPRRRAEDEEAKADTNGIAAALSLVLRGGGRPSKRRRGCRVGVCWSAAGGDAVGPYWCRGAGPREGGYRSSPPTEGSAVWTARRREPGPVGRVRPAHHEGSSMARGPSPTRWAFGFPMSGTS